MSHRRKASYSLPLLLLVVAASTAEGEPPRESLSPLTRACGSCRMEPIEGTAGKPAAFAIPDPTRNLGVKSVLVMLVDFAEMPGGNTTPSIAVQVVESVGRFYERNSFGQMSFGVVHATPVLRMPRSGSDYVSLGSPLQLLIDARAAAEANGFVTTNYDFHLVSFTYIGFPWSGLGFIGERGAFAQDPFLSWVTIAHELGHNLGNWHAGAWEAADDAIVGPGYHVEYGNVFDIMGASLAGHFNANFKYQLGWLRAENISTVTTSGTFRLHAMDTGDALDSTRRYALRIPGGAPLGGVPTDYWIDFRQQYTNNPWAQHGPVVKWCSDYPGGLNSHLLDTTPGTPDGMWDAPLVVGRTLSDPSRNLHITTVNQGGSGAEAFVDVQIQFSSTSNTSPSVLLAASDAQVDPGETVSFTANAADPDGDPIYFHWDFGDRTVNPASFNQSTTSKSWDTAGEFNVRCTVSDAKGGTASASVIVRVGDPDTFRVSGSVTAMGLPLAGVRVHNGMAGAEYRGAITDSAGQFTLAGLRSGAATLYAVKPGYTIAPTFENPVTLNSTNMDGLIFKAAPQGQPLLGRFQPNAGRVGDRITIEGYGFGSVSSVRFGEFTAPYTLASPNELVAIVPQGAVTSPIRLSTATGGDASIEEFSVTPTPPDIVAQPESRLVVVRTTTRFSVFSAGSGPLTFQWRKEGLPIPGATNAQFEIVNVQTNDAGNFDVVLVNPLGVVTSHVAILTVYYIPTLPEALDAPAFAWETSAPIPWTTQTLLNHDGEDAAISGHLGSLSAESWLQTTLVGPLELNFWWLKMPQSRFLCACTGPDGTRTLMDEEGSNTNWQRAALYVPDGTNLVRWTCRPSAILEEPRVWIDEVSTKPIDDTTPRILESPQPLVVEVGATVTLRIRADGYRPLRYQWFKTASPGLFTATNETLTLINVGPGDTGDYGVYVYNLLGGVFSPTARLTVTGASAPGLHLTRVNNGVFITWSEGNQWQLEAAPFLDGPWRPVADGGSHSTAATDIQQFFRLRKL